jgi:predicted dehydrogenase
VKSEDGVCIISFAMRIGVAGAGLIGLWLLKKSDDFFDIARHRETGGGPVLTDLVHDIADLRFICGEIVEVQALVSNKVRRFAVEDAAALLLKFANGAIGTVMESDATPGPWSWEWSSGENAAYPRQNQPCYLFAGTKGSLAVPTMQLWSYPGQDGWYAPLTCAELTAPSFDPIVEQLRHFLAIIARGETPLISVEDAAGTIAVVEALREAARTGACTLPGKLKEQAA